MLNFPEKKDYQIHGRNVKIELKIIANVDFYNLPSTLSKRATNQGTGFKVYFNQKSLIILKHIAPLYVEKNAKENPMPGKYEVD